MDYEYDVFVSYHRKEPVLGWVRTHFVPLLDEWLSLVLGKDARIFVDEDIEAGDTWSQRLKSALLGSRVLVPVFAPSYFRRAWCTSEFHNMVERETMLGYRTSANPAGLICPVWFHRCPLPPVASSIQIYDLSEWTINVPSYRTSDEYPPFIKAMKRFVAQVAPRVESAPPWDAEWPTLDHPPAADPIAMSVPRL